MSIIEQLQISVSFPHSAHNDSILSLLELDAFFIKNLADSKSLSSNLNHSLETDLLSIKLDSLQSILLDVFF